MWGLFLLLYITAYFPHITNKHPKTPRSEHRATLSNKPTEACYWLLGFLTLYRDSLSKSLASQPGKKVEGILRYIKCSFYISYGGKNGAEVRPLFGLHHVSTCNVSQITGASRIHVFYHKMAPDPHKSSKATRFTACTSTLDLV